MYVPNTRRMIPEQRVGSPQEIRAWLYQGRLGSGYDLKDEDAHGRIDLCCHILLPGNIGHPRIPVDASRQYNTPGPGMYPRILGALLLAVSLVLGFSSLSGAEIQKVCSWEVATSGPS